MAFERQAVEYRSEQRWGDLPVGAISVGVGRPMAGIGWDHRAGSSPWGMSPRAWWPSAALPSGCSVGGVAVGLAAVGAVAIGLVAVGAVAIGLFMAGAVAIGLTAVDARSRSGCPGPRPPDGIAPMGAYMPGMGAQVAGGRLAGNRLV